ncbi:MAG: hypothetical protein ACTHPD_16315 [Rhizomicrobium sp.]
MTPENFDRVTAECALEWCDDIAGFAKLSLSGLCAFLVLIFGATFLYLDKILAFSSALRSVFSGIVFLLCIEILLVGRVVTNSYEYKITCRKYLSALSTGDKEKIKEALGTVETWAGNTIWPANKALIIGMILLIGIVASYALILFTS